MCRHPISPVEALRAVACAARAAHDLHEAGIVHRDINPDNVLLADDGGRLADLGLAQVLQPGVAVTGIGRVESVEYIDPVVLGGGQPSRLTDVYGIGMTLHRAISGEGMFGQIAADQPMMAMRAVLSRSPSPSPPLAPRKPHWSRNASAEISPNARGPRSTSRSASRPSPQGLERPG